METKGIEALKAVLKFLITTGEAVDVSLADDKITLSDAANLFPVVATIGPAVSHLTELGAEIADLSDDELKELDTFIKEELELVDKKMEHDVEHYVELALDSSKIIQRAIATFAKK